MRVNASIVLTSLPWSSGTPYADRKALWTCLQLRKGGEGWLQPFDTSGVFVTGSLRSCGTSV